jgi:hypothetical protein
VLRFLFIFLFGVILAACSATSTPPVETETIPPSLTPRPSATQTETLSPTRTLRPTITNTATSTPLPEVAWSVPAVEIKSWTETLAFDNWGATTLQIWDGPSRNIQDISLQTGEVESLATPTPFYSLPYLIESPSKTDQLVIECNESGIQLRNGETVINNFGVETDCYISVNWSPDSLAISIVSSDHDVYVWELDSAEPKLIGHAAAWLAAYWSPDSRQLLITVFSPEMDAGTAKFTILSRDGQSVRSLETVIAAGNGWEGFFGWVTNDIVTNYQQCGSGCGSRWAYDAYNGDVLFSYIQDYSAFDQGGLYSIDKRWVAIDLALDYEHQYLLYDLWYRQEFIWRAEEGLQLDFVGWSDDSSQFYFREPYEPFTEIPSATLITLDPYTHKTNPLVEQTLFAQLSNQLDMLFIVTDVNMPTYKAALYDLSGKPITEAVPINFEAYYGQPNLPFSWATSQDKLVVIDANGQLWHLDGSGTIRLLSESLTGNEPLESWRIEWSFDDKYLFVNANDRAWIVALE